MASSKGAADLAAEPKVTPPTDQAMLDRMNARLNARRAQQESGERTTPKPAPQASQPTTDEAPAEETQEPEKDPNAPEEIQHAEYAFIVMKNADGSFAITPNLNLPVTSARVPTNDDVWQAFHNILKDLQTQQIAQICGQIAGQAGAQAGIQMFQQMAQQMAQGQGAGAQSADEILKRLAAEKQAGPRG